MSQAGLRVEARADRQAELLAECLKVPRPTCFEDPGYARMVVGEDILIVDALGRLRPTQQAARSQQVVAVLGVHQPRPATTLTTPITMAVCLINRAARECGRNFLSILFSG